MQKCAASRPAEKSADGAQRLHLTRRRPLSSVHVGNRRSARARLHPSGVPNLRKAGRQFRDGPGNPRKDGESPAARAGAGADRGRLFFSRHQLLTATYTTYTRYTRPARSGDAPGNSGSWRGGRCKIARTRRRERDGGNCRTLGSKGGQHSSEVRSGRAHCRKVVEDPPTPSRCTTPRHCQHFWGQFGKVLNRIESCGHHRMAPAADQRGQDCQSSSRAPASATPTAAAPGSARKSKSRRSGRRCLVVSGDIR